MAKGITLTGVDTLARAYYGLDLIGDAAYREKQARQVSIKGCLRNGLITEDHQITEQGLWELRRQVDKQRRKIGTK